MMLFGLVLGTSPLHAYSQLTHEELIDLLWVESIRPLLVDRYPLTTEAGLRRAHAYAYGGCLIQDIGYYPFGKTFFSDLAHHVRTGEFVSAMIRNARDVDELAFAVGALSHWVGDSIGHSEAVNPSIALMFPDLASKYGPVVTYEQSPTGHGRTEFGFDVTQTAYERYAPRAYRKHIGFRVARQLLYRTFEETYGLRARGILGPARSAVRTYRWAVTSLLPAFLYAQVVRLSDDLPVEKRDVAREQFLRLIASSEYATMPGITYSKPGIRAHILALVVRIIPKIGTLKVLDTESPTPETEDLFLRSAIHALGLFRELLTRLRFHPGEELGLEDIDLDTGRKAAPGESAMIDQVFAEITTRIAEQRKPVPAGIRDYLLKHYSDPGHPIPSSGNSKAKQRLSDAIEMLRGADQ